MPDIAHCVGGVNSPLLLNVALHGLEEAAGMRYVSPGSGSGETKPGCPVVIRYAMTWWPCVIPVIRPNRSRRGWRNGWRPRVFASTRTSAQLGEDGVRAGEMDNR